MLEKGLKISVVNNKFIKITLLLIAFATCIQILLGASVRLTNSGLSCPDWPLCYGAIYPSAKHLETIENMNFTYTQVMLEWYHRANAAFIIGPLTILTLILVFLSNISTRKLKSRILLLFTLLLIQGLLGGLTVFEANSPWSVAIHLSFAFIFLE